MTQVIANILINKVLNTAGYDVEKQINLIEKVEKMLNNSIKLEIEYKKIVKNVTTDVTDNDVIEPEKESIESSSDNKDEENKPAPVVETSAQVTQETQETPVTSTPVVQEKKQENITPIPTRPTKSISNAEKTMSFKEKVASSLSLLAEESKKPDNRTYEEKVQGMKDFFDPTDPEGKKAEKLMDKAQELLGYDEYETMRNAFNKPETFQRLCNLWDYFHREIPDNWPERPNIED